MNDKVTLPNLVGEPFAEKPQKGPADPVPAGARIAPGRKAPSTWRKLWDLEHKHHCPIIGTCLGIEELQRFARRHHFGGDRRDAFALHVEAAGRCGTRNPLSVDVHKYLDRKHAACLRSFAAISDDAGVLAAWKLSLERGDVAGAIWATLTHKSASPETRHRVYADIHMLSHQAGAGQAADLRRLEQLGAENAELRRSVEGERRERGASDTALRHERDALRERLLAMQAELAEVAELRRRLEAFESGVAVVSLGRRVVELSAANDQRIAAARRAGELATRLAQRDTELAALHREFDQARRERDALERLMLAPVLADEPTPECKTTSADCAACAPSKRARCVLCVGGRTALLAQYRALAERLGIRLIHHDGGQEESVSRLPDMINGADAVICPTDCVSHSAYYRLKSHCKRSGKPCLMFKGAGVSSFALALDALAGNHTRVCLPGKERPG